MSLQNNQNLSNIYKIVIICLKLIKIIVKLLPNSQVLYVNKFFDHAYIQKFMHVSKILFITISNVDYLAKKKPYNSTILIKI